MPPLSDVTTSGTVPVANRYVIERLLGRGGMGHVFLAQDLQTHRPVALKVVSDSYLSHPSMHERLVQEGHLAASLRHPNICAIYEVGTLGDRPYIAMEYVEGDTLDVLLARGPLATAQILPIAMGLASALEAARRTRVVHRDFKPTNIVVTAGGAVKVLDFGLARLEPTAGAGDHESADRGAIVGTAEYMSPEQAMGRRTDHRSDLFALGVVMYELLSGRLPFAGATTLERLWTIVNTAPAPLVFDDAGRQRLVAIVMRLLARDPAARYQTAADVEADLARIAAPERRSAHRRRTLALLRPLAGVAAGLMLTLGGLVPGTHWLTATGEQAWTRAVDQGTSVWIVDPLRADTAPLVHDGIGADAIWL
jgi:serine/threonine protein kinase